MHVGLAATTSDSTSENHKHNFPAQEAGSKLEKKLPQGTFFATVTFPPVGRRPITYDARRR